MAGQKMRRIDLRGSSASSDDAGISSSGPDISRSYRSVVPRAEVDVAATLRIVEPIVADVRDRGLAAINDYSLKFDGVEQSDIRVPRQALRSALHDLDPAIRAGLTESIARLRLTCEAELESDTSVEVAPGGVITQRLIAMDRVGLYVPGGVAPLVSSVVMNVVPAQVAGVGSIALTSSPNKAFGGLPHPTILAACELLGVAEVYAVGGAQAIGMFAYGAGPCRPVDLITGPGNIYTVSAKRLVKGIVGIDSEAGPTEIAVLADDTAHAGYVAADLISQAEHDPMAASVLVTDSLTLADDVEAEIDKQVAVTKHVERITTALTGPQSAIVLVDDLDQGLDVVNAYAAEHLSVQARDAGVLARRVRNGGAIFVGPFAPVSLGDYCAGSNHVLPTGGCACHSSGLSVRSFLKAVHLIEYTEQALAEVAGHVVTLAEAEDLPGHAAAVRVRAGRP